MNETLRTIDLRRSTRVYDQKSISKEDKQTILMSALNAPTAGNMVLYSMIDVTDEGKKQQLSVLCDNQPFIAKAPMVILFVADALKWYNVYNQLNGTNLKPSIADFYLAMADAHIAAQNAVIAAESLNVGSCYIGDIVENYESIKDLFNLPQYVNPVCLLVFGYKKDGVLPQRPKRFNLEDVVFENNYYDKSMDVFKNKFNHLSEKEQSEMVEKVVNGTFNRKQNAEFFKEMNRSLTLMVNEYIKD